MTFPIDTYDIREAVFLDCIGGISATGNTVEHHTVSPSYDNVLVTLGSFSNADTGNGVILSPGTFVKLTTITHHDVILMVVACGTDGNDGVSPAVSSITAASVAHPLPHDLNFTRVGGGNFQVTGLSNQPQMNLEFWMARIDAVLTAVDVTINLTAVADNVGWVALAFKDADYFAPLDTDPSLPAFDGSNTGSSVTISTAAPNDVLVWAGINEGAGASNYPSGFTVLVTGFAVVGGGSGNIEISVAYLRVSAIQTTLTLQPITGSLPGVCLVSALKGY